MNSKGFYAKKGFIGGTKKSKGDNTNKKVFDHRT